MKVGRLHHDAKYGLNCSATSGSRTMSGPQAQPSVHPRRLRGPTGRPDGQERIDQRAGRGPEAPLPDTGWIVGFGVFKGGPWADGCRLLFP